MQFRDLFKRLYLYVHWRTWRGRVVVWASASIAALAVVFFAQGVDEAIELFHSLRERYFWLPLILTPVGGIAIVWLGNTWFSGSEGSGIPQVIASLRESNQSALNQRLVSMRIAVGKVLLTTAGLFCGFSTGREGPSVQVGASVMHAFRNRLPKNFPVDAHQLILAGGSVGLAAAFNTPLAGIVFAIEELGRKFEEKTNGVLLTGVILAGAISIYVQGNYTYFGKLPIGEVSSDLLMPMLISAVAGGILGGIFSRSILWTVSGDNIFTRWKKAHPRNPYLLAGICGLLIALLGLASNGDVHGSGYMVTSAAIAGERELSLLFAGEKFIATLLSYFSGIPGGIFAPSLSIGAGLGEGLSQLVPSDAVVMAWVALCMAAFLAGVTQAPITSFVIVMEMTDGHTMVVSLMAVAFLASMLARVFSRPLYQTLSYQMAKKARQSLATSKPQAPPAEKPES